MTSTLPITLSTLPNELILLLTQYLQPREYLALRLTHPRISTLLPPWAPWHTKGAVLVGKKGVSLDQPSASRVLGRFACSPLRPYIHSLDLLIDPGYYQASDPKNGYLRRFLRLFPTPRSLSLRAFPSSSPCPPLFLKSILLPGSPTSYSLRSLSISHIPLHIPWIQETENGDPGPPGDRDSPWFPQLHTLSLESCRMAPDTLCHLLMHTPNLRTLYIASSMIFSTGDLGTETARKDQSPTGFIDLGSLLAQYTPRITTLSVDSDLCPVALLASIASRASSFPHLRCLGLVSSPSNSPHPICTPSLSSTPFAHQEALEAAFHALNKAQLSLLHFTIKMPKIKLLGEAVSEAMVKALRPTVRFLNLAGWDHLDLSLGPWPCLGELRVSKNDRVTLWRIPTSLDHALPCYPRLHTLELSSRHLDPPESLPPPAHIPQLHMTRLDCQDPTHLHTLLGSLPSPGSMLPFSEDTSLSSINQLNDHVQGYTIKGLRHLHLTHSPRPNDPSVTQQICQCSPAIHVSPLPRSSSFLD
ncbi:MAG: hypothetical protein DHS80DRAFT_22108 [Piptocephalis tieghemiana]|nr:MAG: hypothetical protein DHS80DRAFT_22108 [Piptocephalis tieghemiana]